MRTTKVMLVSLVTFVITCMCVGLVGYVFTDSSYRECIANGGTMMFMLVFGWIPSFIVGYDYNEYLKK